MPFTIPAAIRLTKNLFKHRGAVIADQAVTSLATFLMVLIIARSAGPSFLGEFTMFYGLALLAWRIQSAFITMPMATAGMRAEANMRRLFRVQTRFSLAALATLVPISLFWGSVIVGTSNALSEAATVACGITAWLCKEFIRRYFLVIQRPIFALAISSFYGLILIIGLSLTLGAEASVGSVFQMMIVAGSAGAAILLKEVMRQWRLPRNRSEDPFFSAGWGLLVTNVTQWVTSQVPNFALFMLADSRALGVFAVLRSAIAPLNVLVLSFEGILPMRFARAKESFGSESVLRNAWKEIGIFSIVVLVAIAFSASFGDLLIRKIFGDQTSESVAAVLVLFLIWYLFSAAGQIFLIANRALNYPNAGVFPSLVNLLVLLVGSVILTVQSGLVGTVTALVFAELCAACLLMRHVYVVVRSR